MICLGVDDCAILMSDIKDFCAGMVDGMVKNGYQMCMSWTRVISLLIVPHIESINSTFNSFYGAKL